MQGTTLVWPQVASRPPYVFEVYGTCNNPKMLVVRVRALFDSKTDSLEAGLT